MTHLWSCQNCTGDFYYACLMNLSTYKDADFYLCWIPCFYFWAANKSFSNIEVMCFAECHSVRLDKPLFVPHCASLLTQLFLNLFQPRQKPMFIQNGSIQSRLMALYHLSSSLALITSPSKSRMSLFYKTADQFSLWITA